MLPTQIVAYYLYIIAAYSTRTCVNASSLPFITELPIAPTYDCTQKAYSKCLLNWIIIFWTNLLRTNTLTFMLVSLRHIAFNSMPTQLHYTKMSQCLVCCFNSDLEIGKSYLRKLWNRQTYSPLLWSLPNLDSFFPFMVISVFSLV